MKLHWRPTTNKIELHLVPLLRVTRNLHQAINFPAHLQQLHSSAMDMRQKLRIGWHVLNELLVLEIDVFENFHHPIWISILTDRKPCSRSVIVSRENAVVTGFPKNFFAEVREQSGFLVQVQRMLQGVRKRNASALLPETRVIPITENIMEDYEITHLSVYL